jgi:DtxR family transcriptional regulator, Mn-dependent transcriptional regulator
MSTLEIANDSTYWRAFEDNKITHSVAHYLMAVDKLLLENGYARVTDVASFLKITRGAASLALTQLKDKGFIKEDPNRFLLLTDKGKNLSQIVVKNYALLNRFFRDILGIPSELANMDACKMEHLLSEQSSVYLHRFLQVLFTKPELLEQILHAMKNEGSCCEKDKTCLLCESFEACLNPNLQAESM